MIEMNRRDLVLSAGAAAATLGLAGKVAIIDAAQAQQGPEVGKGFFKYKIGDIEMMSFFDGDAPRKIDPSFVKNATIEQTTEALKKAGLAETFNNPFVVPLAKAGGKTILFDAGTGGQLAPSAGKLQENMKAAGVDPASVDTVLVTHFHPDHIFGLMAKDTNAPVYAKAEIIVGEAEYKAWTAEGLVERVPEGRKGLVRRIQAVFPVWQKEGRLKTVGDDVEVAPGIRTVNSNGHSPGHTSYHVSSAGKQLFVLGDAVTFGPLFLANPGWHVMFDQDAAVAEASRRRVIDRAVAEKAAITAYHFVFPSVGMVSKDGAGYALASIG